MIRSRYLEFLFASAAALTLAACGESRASASDGIPATPPSAAAKAVALAADPGEAVAVVDAKVAGAADAVTVVGRIRDIVGGYVAFTLMDDGVPYCGKQCKEDCMTPWDYCCEGSDRITANSLAVEAQGADGKPIASPALPDLRLLDLVKVKGKLVKDEHGNLTLLASGIFRVERPDLPAGLHWPQ